MKSYFLFALCFVLGLSVGLLTESCKNEPPVQPPKPATLTLKAEDASSTEAWLKATTTETPATVALLRDGQRVTVLRLLISDSLLVDEGLLPKRTYTYQLQKLASDSSVVETSSSVQVTTMDTTSHNFTWQIDTLGVTSSTLYDVAIINDTLAYAVGEMYLRDSTGQMDPQAYNLARWNGRAWELSRIRVRDFGGGSGYYPLYCIYAFAENDVWVASDADLIQWNGLQWTARAFFMTSIPFDGQVRKMWGTDGSNLYLVGRTGAIYYYNGSTWRRVASGTQLPLNDVWGGSSPMFGGSVALIAASFKYTAGEKRILRVRQGDSIDTVSWPMQDRRVHSIWFDNRSSVFVSGGGIFRMNRSKRWVEQPVPIYYTNRIRGNAENDVFVVGDFGIAAHFNGVTWKDFPEVRLSGIYESLSFKDNLVVAVGWGGSRSFVLRGVRL